MDHWLARGDVRRAGGARRRSASRQDDGGVETPSAKESALWVAEQRAGSLEPWRAKSHADAISGKYIGGAQHCRNAVDLWQVGVAFGEFDKPKTDAWFLVRWKPPYRFEMFDVGATPGADCDEKDEAADGEHTLFPTQAWRD